MKDLKALTHLYLAEANRRIKMIEDFKGMGHYDLAPFSEVDGYEFAKVALEGILEDVKRLEGVQDGERI